MLDREPGGLSMYENGRYHNELQESIGHVPYIERAEHDLELGRERCRLLKKFVRDGRLLDIGCSNGGFLKAAKECGFEPVGMEVNPALASFAEGYSKCAVLPCPAEDIGAFADGRFDAITLHDVIEHLPEPMEVLATTARKLTPGGVLVLDTPDAACIEQEGLSWKHIRPQEHLWYFDEPYLRKMLERAGLNVLGVDRPIYGKLVVYAGRKG